MPVLPDGTQTGKSMGKFIRKVLFTATLFTALIALIFWSARSLIRSSVFDGGDGRNILVVGDSHTECAIDDNIFSRSVNISLSATSYAVSFLKIKRMIQDNPRIDTVLLSFHSNSLSPDAESWNKGDIINEHLAILVFLSEFKDIYPLVRNVDFYFAFAKATFTPHILKMLAKRFRGQVESIKSVPVGGYKRLDRDKLRIDIDQLGNNDPERVVMDTSSLQYHYLQRTILLCNQAEVKLILINCPIYKVDRYMERVRFDSLRTALFPGVDYLDFSAFPLPDRCYGDITHLNYRGAEIFSTYLQTHGLY